MSRATALLAGLLVACGGNDAEQFKTKLRDGVPEYEPWAEPADCEPVTYYEDADGDGYGVENTAIDGETCRPLAGYATRSGDCDDRSSGVSPMATEICDGRDNDCDGAIDDDDEVEAQPIWYTDADGDGYGTDEAVAQACEGPPEAAMLDGDCDDADEDVHPGRSEELEDGVDNNCDGLTDFVGNLSGTWSTALGSGETPGLRDCELSWDLRGFWAPELCPDCEMSFWMDPIELEDGTPSGCLPPSEDGFGIHVMGSEDAGFYLGITYARDYTYYGYAYYYYGYTSTYTYYEFVSLPEVSLTLDGGSIQFEDGPIDEPVTDGGYRTNWFGFDGTIE